MRLFCAKCGIPFGESPVPIPVTCPACHLAEVDFVHRDASPLHPDALKASGFVRRELTATDMSLTCEGQEMNKGGAKKK